jgi:hypothetical protein
MASSSIERLVVLGGAVTLSSSYKVGALAQGQPTPKVILLCNKGVCHTLMTLPFTLKSISKQKKNYGSSNISPRNQKKRKKNLIFKKIL